MPVKQFRSAGPVTLAHYTWEDLQRLRQAVGRDPLLKYLTFCQEIDDAGTPRLQLFAQATAKISAARWRKVLGARVGPVHQAACPRVAMRRCQGLRHDEATGQFHPAVGPRDFEEFGRPPRAGQGARTDRPKV